jgi:hydrogenase expression/formation protein HypE
MMAQQTDDLQAWSCPLPLRHQDKIVVGHGGGGKMTHDLITRTFWKHFQNETLNSGNDAAVVNLMYAPSPKNKLVISTDSHVVSPLFFPGGDIGRLAICGTVNDVAMMGAKPVWLTAGFILEEGFEIIQLERVLISMRRAAEEAGVAIVAGDTKVVQHGKGDGIYINTTGIGLMTEDVVITGDNAQPGDIILISGSIGEHGIAVLTARGELGLETQVFSDVAPLNFMVEKLLQSCKGIHVLRDPTRGGLATTLKEISLQSKVCITLEENMIPVHPSVSAACELLGFDPLYVANEGKMVIILHPSEADQALAILKEFENGKLACRIGEVKASPSNTVLLKTPFGTTRLIEMMSGEQLPRIC